MHTLNNTYHFVSDRPTANEHDPDINGTSGNDKYGQKRKNKADRQRKEPVLAMLARLLLRRRRRIANYGVDFGRQQIFGDDGSAKARLV